MQIRQFAGIAQNYAVLLSEIVRKGKWPAPVSHVRHRGTAVFLTVARWAYSSRSGMSATISRCSCNILILGFGGVRCSVASNFRQRSRHALTMRLWTLHPQYLDAQGLTALWRESLLARKVLQGALDSNDVVFARLTASGCCFSRGTTSSPRTVG